LVESGLRVHRDKIPRRTVGLKKPEVTRGWRKLHNEDFYNFCPSQNIIKVIKLRRMRWVGYVTRIVETRNILI
jgi:hypothetical protein